MKIKTDMHKIKCTKCDWKGTEDQRLLVVSESLKKMGVKGFDHVCPCCESDEFYEDNDGEKNESNL